MMAQLYNTSAPHPFPGHRVSGIAEAQAGNLRMCRAEPGYIANVHNTRCKAGWEEPSRGNKLRKEGPLKLSEIDEVEKMHRGWGIPFPITDMQWISGKHPPYQQQQG